MVFDFESVKVVVGVVVDGGGGGGEGVGGGGEGGGGVVGVGGEGGRVVDRRSVVLSGGPGRTRVLYLYYVVFKLDLLYVFLNLEEEVRVVGSDVDSVWFRGVVEVVW